MNDYALNFNFDISKTQNRTYNFTNRDKIMHLPDASIYSSCSKQSRCDIVPNLLHKKYHKKYFKKKKKKMLSELTSIPLCDNNNFIIFIFCVFCILIFLL